MSKENPTKAEIRAIMLLIKNGWLKVELTVPTKDTESMEGGPE